MAEKSFVVAWRSGLLEIRKDIPEGGICIAVAAPYRLRAILDAIARLSKPTAKDDPKTYKPYYLCPGVPEATSDRAAMNSLIEFQFRFSERLAR